MIERATPAAGSEKTVFFCPNCEFDGDMNEEFSVTRLLDTIRYACPECGAIVATRPIPAGR